MTRTRVVVLVAGGIALATLLLDWTVGALDVYRIGHVADLRALRAACRDDGGAGALALAPDLDLAPDRGRWTLRTDRFGARTGPAATAPAVALRVLVLGDGAALGAGVADELTFARGLQRERAADGRAVAVVVAAQPFFDLADSGALVEAWLARVRPDVVLVCGPAVEGVPSALVCAVAAAGGSARPAWARILPSLWLLQQRISGGDVAGAPPPPTDVVRGAALERARAAARAVGVPLHLVELGAGTLAGLCDARGWPVIDAALTADDRRAPVFADPGEGWPSVLGHDLIRDRIAAALADAGLLAPPSGR